MAAPIQLRIVRPFDSAESLVERDAWIVGRSDLLLLGQEDLPKKTLVEFEIVLSSGEAVITGAGWAMAHEPDDGAGTGGLRVKLKSLDRQSKGRLRKMLELQKKGLASRPTPDSAPPHEVHADPVPSDDETATAEQSAAADDQPSEEVPANESETAEEPSEEAVAVSDEAVVGDDEEALDDDAPVEDVSVDELGGSWFPPGADAEIPLGDGSAATEPLDSSANDEPPPLPSEPEHESVSEPTIEVPDDARAQDLEAREGPKRAQSGVRQRPVSIIQPPANREELLERLRQRAQHIAKAKVAEAADKAAG